MNERKFTTQVIKKLEKLVEDKVIPRNFICEIKLTKTDKIMKSAVHEHQIQGIEDFLKGRIYKIPDSGMQARFGILKPADVLSFKADKGYICVVFYVPRHAEMYLIPVEWWTNSEKKSFKRDDLKEFCV